MNTVKKAVSLALVFLCLSGIVSVPSNADTPVYTVHLDEILGNLGISCSSITSAEVIPVRSTNPTSRSTEVSQAVNITVQNGNSVDNWLVMCIDTQGNVMTPTVTASSARSNLANRNVTFTSTWPSDLQIACGISCFNDYNSTLGLVCQRPYRIGAGWKSSSSKTVSMFRLKYNSTGPTMAYPACINATSMTQLSVSTGTHNIQGEISPANGQSAFIVKEMEDRCFVNYDGVGATTSTAQIGFSYDGVNYVTEKVTVLPDSSLG